MRENNSLPFTENVIPVLLAWRRAGLGAALITLTRVDGSSPRRIGSQMAVAANGAFAGTISSGCAEAAIVTEAQAAIAARTRRTVRYGAGSKYIDVVLPCGSGIDVHFDPTIGLGDLERLAELIAARVPASLAIDPAAERPSMLGAAGGRGLFLRPYSPVPRIVVAGRGVGVDHVARFARDLEWDVVVASPDDATLIRAGTVAQHTQYLSRPDDFDTAPVDRHSAVVLLFHDHDWEPAILAKCEPAPAFFIGALGSRRTHAQRCALLAQMGCSAGFIARIKSPVGLDIGARNPPQIALSIIAQILAQAPAE